MEKKCSCSLFPWAHGIEPIRVNDKRETAFFILGNMALFAREIEF